MEDDNPYKPPLTESHPPRTKWSLVGYFVTLVAGTGAFLGTLFGIVAVVTERDPTMLVIPIFFGAASYWCVQLARSIRHDGLRSRREESQADRP